MDMRADHAPAVQANSSNYTQEVKKWEHALESKRKQLAKEGETMQATYQEKLQELRREAEQATRELAEQRQRHHRVRHA